MSRKISLILSFMGFILCINGDSAISQKAGGDMEKNHISLPIPATIGSITLEESIARRRSIRKFSDDSLSLSQISQLLWAAQGITNAEGLRTAPSAGALYPLEIYLLAEKVAGLQKGLYRYIPIGHKLLWLSQPDAFRELADSVAYQQWVGNAAAALAITAVYERVTRKYGERGVRYAHIEVGCAVQSLYLQAVSLGLGTTVIGAFEDQEISRLLALQKGEHPLAILPFGKPAAG